MMDECMPSTQASTASPPTWGLPPQPRASSPIQHRVPAAVHRQTDTASHVGGPGAGPHQLSKHTTPTPSGAWPGLASQTVSPAARKKLKLLKPQATAYESLGTGTQQEREAERPGQRLEHPRESPGEESVPIVAHPSRTLSQNKLSPASPSAMASSLILWSVSLECGS